MSYQILCWDQTGRGIGDRVSFYKKNYENIWSGFLSDDKHDKMQFWNEANNFSKQSVQLNAIWEPVKKCLAVFCKNRDQKIYWRAGEWVCKISTLYFSVENKLHKNAKCLALSVSSVMKPCWMKNTHQSGRIINRMVLNVLFSRKIRCLSELKGKLLEKHLEKDLKMNYRIFLTSTQEREFSWAAKFAETCRQLK